MGQSEKGSTDDGQCMSSSEDEDVEAEDTTWANVLD